MRITDESHHAIFTTAFLKPYEDFQEIQEESYSLNLELYWYPARIYRIVPSDRTLIPANSMLQLFSGQVQALCCNHQSPCHIGPVTKLLCIVNISNTIRNIIASEDGSGCPSEK